jgi:hypothetical protein
LATRCAFRPLPVGVPVGVDPPPPLELVGGGVIDEVVGRHLLKRLKREKEAERETH